MLRSIVKHILRPMARKALGLPTVEEQNYVGYRGVLHSAATFCARNFVAGDYAEFGVWQGDSFATAFHAITRARNAHLHWIRSQPTQESVTGRQSPEFAEWRGYEPRFIAFDSFEGLPDTGSNELHEHWTRGAFCCPEPRFLANVSSRGVPVERIITVPGFYERTLCDQTRFRHNIDRIAIAMIDCDLYDSTLDVLNFLTNLLVQGSVIIFDDWFYYRGSPQRGQQRACREWLQHNPQIELVEFWREPPQPVSFIVNFEKSASSSEIDRLAAARRSLLENDRRSANLTR